METLNSTLATLSSTIELVESVGNFRLPAKVDRRMQELMDRNTEGTISGTERAELESLVELSESLSLLRAKALRLLDRKP